MIVRGKSEILYNSVLGIKTLMLLELEFLVGRLLNVKYWVIWGSYQVVDNFEE